MATMTIRLPDDKHQRLKQIAISRGISINKLFEEFSTQAIAESDAYTRFRLYASQGNTQHGLATLERLDGYFDKFSAQNPCPARAPT